MQRPDISTHHCSLECRIYCAYCYVDLKMNDKSLYLNLREAYTYNCCRIEIKNIMTLIYTYIEKKKRKKCISR